MMLLLTLLLGVLAVLLITAVTGYFVAQEFAFMAVDRSRLKAQAEAGDAGAERALAVTRRTSFMLSGAQLGITVTGLLVGYVAEPLIGVSIGTVFGGIGLGTAIGLAIGTVVALVFSTLVQMLFGELFPKNLAIARPEPVARRLARSTTVYLRLFGWLIWFFDQASNLLLRALRIEPVHDVEHSATARDLEHIVSASRQAGDLPTELSHVLDRILDFPTRPVEHATVPRMRVDTVGAGDSLAKVRALMGAGHSRYPVLGTDPDDIVGVVHLHDVLALEPPYAGTAADIARPALLLPTSLPLPRALAELTESKSKLACVVDEYGGFAGILTVEDIAEELVGEIEDEHDAAAAPKDQPATDGSWQVGGSVNVDEVERVIGRDLPEGDYETLAGLAIAYHHDLPAVGASIRVPLDPGPAALLADGVSETALVVEVLRVDRRVPAELRLRFETLADAKIEEDAR